MIRRFVNDVATQYVRRWYEAAGQPHIDTAIRDLYRSISQEIALRQPTCIASGRCCRFEQYGHRLYTTGLETAWCLRQVPSPIGVGDVDRAREDGTCPFLSNNLCTAHAIKPMGCRVYFCDPTAKKWQNELYERCHHTLIEIHESNGLPYHYGEWRALLRTCVPLLADYRPVDWRSYWADRIDNGPAESDPPDRFVQVRIS